jgi:hypothetical protein
MADAYDDDLTEGLARFRTTTLAIVIALVATLSDTQFWNIRHCISVDLAQEAWLEEMCATINRTFASSVEYSEIVDLLAAVHVGVDASDSAGVNKEKGVLSRQIIGWRNGRYSVIPSLLLEMKPSMHAVRLACRDSFYANLRVHQDGSIHSSYVGLSILTGIGSRFHLKFRNSHILYLQAPMILG